MQEKSATWENCLEYVAMSDIGMRRRNNQDSMVTVLAGSREHWLRRGHLMMVADGMGAHAAGELASKMTTEHVPHLYYKMLDVPPWEALRRSVEDANAKIHSRGQANFDFRGMGTTCSALLLIPQGAVVAQVGDSRVYRVRDHLIEQLTFDHSLVWELIASGQFREDNIPAPIPRNVITRSLGPNPTVEIDLEGPFPVEVGDTYLLCSDGLTGQVTDDELGVILRVLPPKEAARMLIDLANLRGGPDNITVIVVRITGPEMTDPELLGSARSASLERGPVHPYVWVAFGVSLLAAGALWATRQPVAAAVAAVAAAASALVAVGQKFTSHDPSLDRPELDLLGKGPHTSHVVTPNQEFVERISKLLDQLRNAAVEEKWAVDWSRFNEFGRKALAALAANDCPTAIREYCHGVSFMMHQLRHQRRTEANDGPAEPPME